MKRVLITGANSYIGESVKNYLLEEPEQYAVSVRDTMNWNPHVDDFKGIDVVFNVAGIAHIKETAENRHLYFDINRDLSVRIAETAKAAGVKQYILLSTMSVYGMTTGHITKKTPVNPQNAYGQSKAEADAIIFDMTDESFVFTCLRPPMVYGKGCKGNYQLLRKFALGSPVFPNYPNQRSMIYIGNLCEFVKQSIDNPKNGVFFPQNEEYVNTSQMVKLVAVCNGKKLLFTKAFNWGIWLVRLNLVKKVFGNLTYEKVDQMSRYSFVDSISYTEGQLNE